MFKVVKLLIPCIFGIAIYLIPCPHSLDPKAWKLLAIFIATIIALIVKPLPMSSVALISLTTATLFRVITEKEALSGFSSSISWLVVLIFFIARAFVKSGLGKRVAYYFIAKFGRTSLGLSYSLVITELIIAPFMPSSAARAGGIIYPILLSIVDSVNSKNHKQNPQALGAFLAQICFHSNYITSAMFLTAMAANPMIQSFALEQGIKITWSLWSLASSVPIGIILLTTPVFLYLIYPPKLKTIPNSQEFAKCKLKEMGSISRNEKIMILTFGLMLIIWIMGEKFKISVTTAALLGVSLLLLFKIITLEDILSESDAWQTLLWFSILVMLSQQLQKLGIIMWFSERLSFFIKNLDWHYSFIILALIYFYSHYLFASITSHISTMYPTFLSLAITIGTPSLLAALVLGFISSLFSAITHYGSTGAVIFYGTNFVTTSKWWTIGFFISLINIFIMLCIGGFWWKIIHLY